MTTATTSGTSHAPAPTIETLVNRIKGEYLELPGLKLTAWQAQRLWALEAVQCDAILAALVDGAFLRRTKNGFYIRAGESL
jgi:hypothetical protein